jgi:hypothetical protein
MHHDAAGRSAAGVVDERDQTCQIDVSPMQHTVTVSRDDTANRLLLRPPRSRRLTRADRPALARNIELLARRGGPIDDEIPFRPSEADPPNELDAA